MTFNAQQYHTLILASLLHDIGKLLNKIPAGQKKKDHQTYGHDFLRDDGLVQLIEEHFSTEVDAEILQYLVLCHHWYLEPSWQGRRDNRLIRIIRNADRYSSGERPFEKLSGGQAGTSPALDSIFVNRDLGRPLNGQPYRYPPHQLDPKNNFPKANFDPKDDETHYETLIEGFRQAFEKVVSEVETWCSLETWTYSLLERYTWAVPSALNHTPRDISLFDHSRTTCAIAAAHYLYSHSGLAKRRKRFLLIKGDVSGIQDYIYTVANVGPGGVAKRLRARSFFITALIEVVSHWLRQELVTINEDSISLPIAATIFAGGGQFVMLAPNLESVHQKLAQIIARVNRWLWEEFQGDLAFIYGTEEVSGRELAIKERQRGRNICQAIDALNRQVQTAKNERLGTLLKQDGHWEPGRFQWRAEPYNHGDCPSCSRLPARAGEDEPDPDRRFCRRCYQDRVLSERIVDARYIGYWRGSPPSGPNSYWLRRRSLVFFDGTERRYAILLTDLDELTQFDDSPYQLDGFGYHPPEIDAPALVRHFANHVPRFDTMTQLTDFCTRERGCVYGLYTDDHDNACGILVPPGVPPGSYEISEINFPVLQNFGCLAAAAAEGQDSLMGAQLLGVLRADVDYLGHLFANSFREKEEGETKSLSRLATLSRMVDLFFSGWINATLADPPAGKPYDRIYTVYSGGDDLCLVGPWDVIIDFARHMATEFERYVAHNPNITFSAAISVTKPKFPIATSARHAGDLLDTAKNAGRNRLNLFGVIARWRDLPPYQELDEALAAELKRRECHHNLIVTDLWQWAEMFDEELSRYRRRRSAGEDRYPISAAFAHRLLHYAEMARNWEEAEEIRAEDMLYLARLAYDLGRNINKYDSVPQAIKEALAALTQLNNRTLMAGMRMPLTYALYRNRERSRER